MNLAPIPFPGCFMMRALHRDVRARADGERLFHGLDERVAFVAHMRNVAGRAGFARCARARNQFAAVRIA